MHRILIFLIINLIGITCFSQSCCGELINEIYPNIIRHNTTYSTNQLDFNGLNISLSARITEATDNQCEKKPFVLLIHGGGFGAGSPNLMDSIATELAKRGYFTASIQYRLGFKGSSTTCPMDTVELIRAWYRASQDAKSAIRFFKERHEEFNLDTNLFFAGGWSAGGYVLTGLAWMNDDSEKPIQAGLLNDTLIGGQLYTRPDLGSPHGTSNINGYSTNVKGIFSFSSSFLFPEHLDETENTAMIYFNNKLDEFGIPWETCEQDAWDYLCPQGLPKSCGIESMLDLFNLYNIPFQYTLFETPTCSHNLHEPCFPMFQNEVDQLVQFLNELSECPIVTGNHTNISSQSTITLVISENEIDDFVNKHSNWSLLDSKGALFQLPNNKRLSKGFYHCIDNLQNAESFNLVIQ
jgi:hypothetical protein